MANFFKNTAITYFQVPQTIMQSTWPQLKPSTQSLLVLLYYLTQRYTRETHQLTDQQIAEQTGMSTNSVSSARGQLIDLELISVRFERGKGYEYRILDPTNGKPIEKIGDFDKLSSERLEEYFRDRLADYDIGYKDEKELDLRALCPFHYTTKTRAHDLHISLAKGGPWRCVNGKCGAKGKLVQLERLLADKDGQEISPSEANRRINEWLRKTARTREREREAEFAAKRLTI